MPVETLTQLMARLNAEGYTDACRTEEDGVHFAHNGEVFKPEELKVDQVIRLEGTSTPDEEVVVFALSSPDGRFKGTFSCPHGVDSDPLDADTMQRLAVSPGVLSGRKAAKAKSVTARP